MANLRRREFIKSLGTVPATLSLPETVNAQIAGDDQEILYRDQLIARWSFQNGFQDTVGNMDAKAAYGSPTVGTYNGRSGVRFDGDDGLMIGNGNENPELSFVGQDDGPVSIGGWVYFDQKKGGNQRGDYAKHHILRNDGEYVLVANPNTGNSETVGFRFGTHDLGGGSGYNTGNNTEDEMDVPIQKWHHFFFVLNPNEYIRFYLDGEMRFSDEDMDGYSPPVTNYWSHQTIGSWYGTSNPSWYDLMRGKISDLRIYDTELSMDDVGQIYTNTGGNSGNTTTSTGGSTRSSSQDSTGETGAGSSKVSEEGGVLDGFATMFREPSENTGAWGAVLGGGVLGAGYLAYRRGSSDEKNQETVVKECPECGSRVGASKRFCGNCGTQINSSEGEDVDSRKEAHQNINVSDYGDLSVQETVKSFSGYQVSEATVRGTGKSTWVITPSTKGDETLDRSHTQKFLDYIKPWTKIEDHPNLLAVYGHGTEPLPWLAVEPADHPTVWDRSSNLSTKASLNLVQQVCEAVHHVTRYGVKYENLDTSSVLLINQNNAKLRGVMDQLSEKDLSLYSAPEEFKGKHTEQTLVYRIGMISYVLLAGTLPYDSQSGNIEDTVRNADPIPPTERESELPSELNGVLMKSLSKSPDERYETVLHLRDELASTV